LNNPILASSEAAGHSASLGNDGNATTFWQSQDADINPWWQVDLERAVTMTRVKVTFPTPGNYRYKIEASSDGQHWTPAVDETQTASTDQIRTENFSSATSAHLLRVTFAGKPAAIAELEISGRLTAQ
jgi:beta-galactosidase